MKDTITCKKMMATAKEHFESAKTEYKLKGKVTSFGEQQFGAAIAILDLINSLEANSLANKILKEYRVWKNI